MSTHFLSTLTDEQTTVAELMVVKHNLNWDWVSDLVNKASPAVLELVRLALDLGLSKEWVAEALDRLGPVMLEFILVVLRKKELDNVPVSAANMSHVEDLQLNDLVKKLLPALLDAFGPQIVDLLTTALIKALAK